MTGTRNLRDHSPVLKCGGGSNHHPVKSEEEDGLVEKVELSLGLSLNGRFGLEPQRSVAKENNNRLFRASSVTDFVNFPVDVELSLYSPLTRTCSLPPETEAEWRKRKELQSLRRSEAKRKRVEKLKNVAVVKGKTREDLESNRKNSVDGNELCRVGLKQSPPSLSPSLLSPPGPPFRLPSQGSIGSQESGGSSGVSDLDSQPFPGTNKTTIKINEQAKGKCNPKIELKANALNETMPCVSTKGNGPDGRRIQGFLYRYGKDEEVRIVCVCHGSFLSPAEFVKHGGGGDVDHPLRHILVTSLFR